MKNKLLILSAVIFVSLFFVSCKKSDNDPLIPFSTRDARITNTWKLKSSEKSITTVNKLGNIDTKVFSFNGTEMTETHTDFFGAYSESIYTYSDILDIQKANIYKQTITADDNISEVNSYWFWFDSDKDKVGIIFENGNTYIINRLAKDELLLEYNKYIVETDENDVVNTYTYSENLTYNAQ